MERPTSASWRTWSILDHVTKNSENPFVKISKFLSCHIAKSICMIILDTNVSSNLDIHTLDLQTKRWETVNVTGMLEVPSPRHSHAAVVYGQSMFIFGGIP